ncbi:MAG: Alpha/beta hydrolase fold-3 domain protein [Herbaspirillum sp.]|nr:Alpha/beta hydrolase fold-3 domain protein [Herbaspirillum sp.]
MKLPTLFAAPSFEQFADQESGVDVTLRIFGKRPKLAGAPLILYFHGGLFNCGAVTDADQLAQALAASAVVVCVDYPLAPELHFPRTVELAFEALQWAWDNAAALGAAPSRVIVAGDQAGGNLAAAVALMARDRAVPNRPVLKAQILITPMLDPFQTTPSMRAAGDCPCRQGWADYLPSAGDAMHPYASPLNSRRLGSLAMALVMTAERDPLRDEAEQYAGKLIAAGVPVQMRRFDGAGNLANAEHPQFEVMTDTVAQFTAVC